MRLFGVFLGLLTAVVMATASSGPAGAGSSCAAAAAVDSASNSLLAAARRGSPAALSRALSRHVNMRRVAMFAIGRHGRKMTPAMRRRYVSLARAYIARQLARHSGRFRGSSVDIVRCRGRVVETRVRPGGQKVLWRVSGRRIRDVSLGGVWLSIMLRDHFADMIRRSGGDMRLFLASLR